MKPRRSDHETATQRLEFARSAYDSAGKSVARAVVISLAQENRLHSILDLWGGGESARLLRTALPDAAIVSAERDENLIPFLLEDARQQGYVAHPGDLRTAPGLYDLVWADLCAQASKATERTLRDSAAKVSPAGFLAVTIMPAREPDRVLTGDSRTLHLPLWLEEITGMTVRLLFPYRRDNGLPMWLVILRRGAKSRFFDPVSYDHITDDLRDDGYWVGYLGAAEDIGQSAYFLLDLINPTFSGTPDLTPANAIKRLGYQNVLKLTDLTPEQRHLVLTMVDMAKETAKRKLAEFTA